MWFSIFRCLLFIFIFLMLFIWLKKIKHNKKKSVYILTMILCLVLGSISYLLPVENLFIDFKSPEEVFNYSCTGEIEDIIYGKNSCMVVYSKGKSSYSYSIFPKSSMGFKLSNLFLTKTVFNKFDEDGAIEVYNILNDYYIYGSTFIGEDMGITAVDSNGENVKKIIMGNSGTKTVLVYTVTDSYNSGYNISINGKKILLSN